LHNKGNNGATEGRQHHLEKKIDILLRSQGSLKTNCLWAT